MKVRVILLLLFLSLGLEQALCYDQLYGRPGYKDTQVLSLWGNAAAVSYARGTELRLAAYSAVAGGAHVRGWLHKDFTWNGASGPARARFDFALCAEVATGTSHSSVEIKVKGFLRDVSTAQYPVKVTLYRYYRASPGYKVFVHGDVVNKNIDMVEGHKYTMGYTVDVSATCYPRSYCPMAGANMGEKGCSFWWQPTGVYQG